MKGGRDLPICQEMETPASQDDIPMYRDHAALSLNLESPGRGLDQSEEAKIPMGEAGSRDTLILYHPVHTILERSYILII